MVCGTALWKFGPLLTGHQNLVSHPLQSSKLWCLSLFLQFGKRLQQRQCCQSTAWWSCCRSCYSPSQDQRLSPHRSRRRPNRSTSTLCLRKRIHLLQSKQFWRYQDYYTWLQNCERHKHLAKDSSIRHSFSVSANCQEPPQDPRWQSRKYSDFSSWARLQGTEPRSRRSTLPALCDTCKLGIRPIISHLLRSLEMIS